MARGKSGSAKRTLRVVAPYNGDVLAEIEVSELEQVDRCVGAADWLYRNRQSWLPVSERIGILERATRIMLHERMSLAKTIAQDGGNPLLMSELEVEHAIESVRLCVEHLRTATGTVTPMGVSRTSVQRVAFTQRDPAGVVVTVSAFNYPVHAIVRDIAASVASGCPVIVSPSPEVPMFCLNFARILRAAGLPADWCQVVVTDNASTINALIADPRVSYLSFTGTQEDGGNLRSKLGPRIRFTFEYGGSAPVFLLEDADQQLASKKLLDGSLYHAGQAFISVQKIFVPQNYALDFAENLARRASDIRVGDPLSPKTQLGPLIRRSEVERVHAWIEDAIECGAECLSGGKPVGPTTYEPTVLLNPPDVARVSHQESRGPVACVYGYEKLSDAIAKANLSPLASRAAVFTNSIDSAFGVFPQLGASLVCINDVTALQNDGVSLVGSRHAGIRENQHIIEALQVDRVLVFCSSQL